jgi:hypothetical protein
MSLDALILSIDISKVELPRNRWLRGLSTAIYYYSLIALFTRKDEFVHTIEIDFEVFKAITARRPSENVTCNDVIREILKLPKLAKPYAAPEPSAGAFFTKGVWFPADTEFRAFYKRTWRNAKIQSGKLMVNGKEAASLSSAAFMITGTNVNGWDFWECLLPSESQWRKPHTFRRASSL